MSQIKFWDSVQNLDIENLKIYLSEIIEMRFVLLLLLLLRNEFAHFTKIAITPVWDFIETWGFRVDDPCDFPDTPISPQKNLPNQTSHTKYFKWS